jgi:transposase
MPRHGKYPDELRERAVRMVLDHGHEYGSPWEAICSVAAKLGPKAETIRLWVRQAERDQGRLAGATSEERAELERLRCEIAELRRANDILKAAAHFLGAGLDRQPKRSSGSSTSTRIGAAMGCAEGSRRSAAPCRSPRRLTTPPGSARRRRGCCATPNSSRRSCGCGTRTWRSTASTRSGISRTRTASTWPAAPSSA